MKFLVNRKEAVEQPPSYVGAEAAVNRLRRHWHGVPLLSSRSERNLDSHWGAFSIPPHV
jgi:hypothetical protein